MGRLPQKENILVGGVGFALLLFGSFGSEVNGCTSLRFGRRGVSPTAAREILRTFHYWEKLFTAMFSLQDAKCYLTRIILQKQREKIIYGNSCPSEHTFHLPSTLVPSLLKRAKERVFSCGCAY